VRFGAFGAVVVSLIVVLSAAPPGRAQTGPAPPLPLPGFVPPYEISRIVRSAGFDPLAPPLREGTTYVVRATDFRGLLMRVVVDGHSGAIRAVNRIVSGPGPYYGPIEMLPPPYGGLSPYGAAAPPEFAAPEIGPVEESAAASAEPPPTPSPALLPVIHPPHPFAAGLPPLPRPRPAELGSSKSAGDAKSAAQPAVKPAAGSASTVPPPTTAPKKPPAVPLPD
jgi:hypothetical protein